jgi:hypothetical protein
MPSTTGAGDEVTEQSSTEFLHRLGPDETHESICPDCLRTISRQPCEADLTLVEEHHICDEVIERLMRERLNSKPPPIN